MAHFSFSLRYGVSGFTSIIRLLSNKPSTQHGIQNIANYFSSRNLCTNIPQYETLKISQPAEYVYHVELNRPQKANSFSDTQTRELTDCFQRLNTEKLCRSVVLSGVGKLFTGGIDIAVLAKAADVKENDPARKAKALRKIIEDVQAAACSLEKCDKPVIAAVHSACIGIGVDIIAAADIRYCSKDAYFHLKEVDMGLAADVGALQRFPKIVGNDSLTREFVYTSRIFGSEEAKQIGFVSAVLDDRDTCIQKGIETATIIAEKSPVAVQTSKRNLIYSRDHTVAEGLEHVTMLNQAMIQSDDCKKAVMASVEKRKPTFDPL